MARLETDGGAGPAGFRSAQNESFLNTSFLQGANAAYIEGLLAAYAADPASVSPDWRKFFADMGVTPTSLGPSWARHDWPPTTNDDWTDALTSDAGPATPRVAPDAATPEDVVRATRDSVRALMMIRAYRMRGHLHANLDPLGLEQRQDHGELDPATYGFTDADYDRKIFIDGVLGLQYTSIFEMVAIQRRT